MKPEQQTETIRRLHCAAGHLNAVIEMVEDGEPCEKVLHQLNAVEAALYAAGSRLLARQLHQSEAAIVAGSSPEKRASELKRLQALYAILIPKSNSTNEVIK